MRDLKISTRLAVGFAVLAAFVALVGVVALFKMQAMHDSLNVVLNSRYPNIKALHTIKDGNANVARTLRELLLVEDPARVKALFDDIATISKTSSAQFDFLKEALVTPKGKEAFGRLTAARAAYREPRDRVMALIKEGRRDEAKALLFGPVLARQMDYMAATDALLDIGDKLLAAADADADIQAAKARWTVGSLIAAALALAATVGLWTIRSTTRPIEEAVRVARSVAAGDLTTQFDSRGTSETAQLLDALQQMQARLASIVGEVRSNADGVATASAQIASGNADLSSRTESQASALEQTASSMEELGSTVRANSDNAQQANQLAMAASAVASQGGAAVKDVVETMKSISESSRRIADIIGTIDGIAFQTNILALNVAVEAARAGEQGRGFAVVASEVRSLAQRSAEAAKEIKVLIGESTERVERGTIQVDQAGATIQDVVTSIRRVTDIMGEISSASREQSAGVAQVSDAVTAMDQATQQNAALVEESAAASESLSTQANQLVSAVAVFKLRA